MANLENSREQDELSQPEVEETYFEDSEYEEYDEPED